MNTSLGAVQSVNAPFRQLAQLLLERDGPYAHAFENPSSVDCGKPVSVGLPLRTARRVTPVLKIGEIVVVAVFVRVLAARPPAQDRVHIRFLWSVDLLAIAPFYRRT